MIATTQRRLPRDRQSLNIAVSTANSSRVKVANPNIHSGETMIFGVHNLVMNRRARELTGRRCTTTLKAGVLSFDVRLINLRLTKRYSG